MTTRDLFKGLAVVIDDELGRAGVDIEKIVESISSEGGYVLELTELPSDDADMDNFRGVSFFVMDWNLENSSQMESDGSVARIDVPDAVKKTQTQLKLDFLEKLQNSRLAPVFIFTEEPLEEVHDALESSEVLNYKRKAASHVFVMSKADVIKTGVFKVLTSWIEQTPSALVLKSWEQEYERAKNELFVDFYSSSAYWPAFLWTTFEQDSLPPADELGRLITRNLFSRMSPFHVDMTPFLPQLEEKRAAAPEEYRSSMLKVLEGERFVRNVRLHKDSISPGDVFEFEGKFWLNIRPDCDCVERDGTTLQLYLLKGERLRKGEITAALNVERGSFVERDDQSIVFAMVDEKTVAFKFKDLFFRDWKELRDHRVGRLLAPFVTRIQQRYSAYLHRPGLPVIPRAAMPQDLVDGAETKAKDMREIKALAETSAASRVRQ